MQIGGARFQGNDKGRDDLFAATPPLETKRMLLSKAATIIVGSCSRKLLFIAKKAHPPKFSSQGRRFY